MKKRQSISVKILYVAALFFILLAGAIFFRSYLSLQRTTNQQVVSSEAMLIRQKQNALRNYLQMARQIVVHYASIDSLAIEQQQSRAIEELSKLRYDEGVGYFFAYEQQGNETYFAFHGTKPELNGTIANLEGTDTKGYAFRKDLIKFAKAGNGNFVTYFYKKPGTDEEIKKLSLSHYYAPWDWVLVTGFYIDDIDAYIATLEEETQQQLNRMLWGIGFITLLVLVLSWLGLRWQLHVLVLSPLSRAVTSMQNLAAGQLDLSLNSNKQDEIGILIRQQRKVTEKVHEIMQQAKATTAYIYEASKALGTNAESVSEGATEQASSVEEVSSSVEEMAANISSTSDHAHNAEKVTKEAVEGIRQGSETTGQTAERMKRIANQIQIVNDIAFQTNLLALNAAVEAARAGNEGRGFAVVAAEVRKLAEKSREAADEIIQLADSGVEVASKAGTQMHDLVPEVEKTASWIQEIAISSKELNQGAGQINNAVQQLNSVTQQNASAASTFSERAQELREQANELAEIIAYFKSKN